MSEMNIVVCLKQILDPEIPTREFVVDTERREAVRGSANLVTNIFCENALETALQFKEKYGAQITVLSFGAESVEDSLRKAIAMKADAGVMVTVDGSGHSDPLYVATVLAAAIRKIGNVDLILTGRESGDWGQGQTGGLIAETLGLPCVSFVDTIDADGVGVRVRRQTDTGIETYSAETPVVLTITNNEQNVPRIPKTRDVMMSYRQPLTTISLGELGIGEKHQYYEIAGLNLPHKEIDCEFVGGETLEEKIGVLATKILSAAAAG